MTEDEIWKKMYADYQEYASGKMPFLVMFARWVVSTQEMQQVRAEKQKQASTDPAAAAVAAG